MDRAFFIIILIIIIIFVIIIIICSHFGSSNFGSNPFSVGSSSAMGACPCLSRGLGGEAVPLVRGSRSGEAVPLVWGSSTSGLQAQTLSTCAPSSSPGGEDAADHCDGDSNDDFEQNAGSVCDSELSAASDRRRFFEEYEAFEAWEAGNDEYFETRGGVKVYRWH
jgi:hypothetical protein